MKVAKFSVVMVVASLVSASAAQAVTQVWFTATPASGPASVTSPGGPGLNTALQCDKTGLSGNVTCAWDIIVQSLTPVGDGHGVSNGYAVRLFGSSLSLGVAGAPAPAFAPNGYTTVAEPLNSGAGYLISGGQITFAGTAGLNNLYSFRLTLTKSALDNSPATVLANNGPTAWGFGDGTAGSVQYGSNQAATGDVPYNGVPGNVPVISIANTPEPMTVGLLGLGVVALIGRRRS